MRRGNSQGRRTTPSSQEFERLLKLPIASIIASPLFKKYNPEYLWRNKLLTIKTDEQEIFLLIDSILYSVVHLFVPLLNTVSRKNWVPGDGMTFIISERETEFQIPKGLNYPQPKGLLDLSFLVPITADSLKITNLLLDQYEDMFANQLMDEEISSPEVLINFYDSSNAQFRTRASRVLAEYCALVGDFRFITDVVRGLSDRTLPEIDQFGLSIYQELKEKGDFLKKFIEEVLFYLFYLDEYEDFVKYWHKHSEDIGATIVGRLSNWDRPPYRYLEFVAKERMNLGLMTKENYSTYTGLLDFIRDDQIKKRWKKLLGYGVGTEYFADFLGS